MRGHTAHVFHQPFELAFSAVRGKVGDLGFETADQVGRGVHDAGTKVINLVGIAFVAIRELGGLRVQAHAKHGAVLALGVAQHVKKGHSGILRGRPMAPIHWAARRSVGKLRMKSLRLLASRPGRMWSRMDVSAASASRSFKA